MCRNKTCASIKLGLCSVSLICFGFNVATAGQHAVMQSRNCPKLRSELFPMPAWAAMSQLLTLHRNAHVQVVKEAQPMFLLKGLMANRQPCIFTLHKPPACSSPLRIVRFRGSYNSSH